MIVLAGAIIWYLTSFGCGVLFYAIGIYAQNMDKPMWFLSGSEVKPTQITDIEQYNRENATMWKVYSLWFFGAGLAYIWSEMVALILMVGSFVIGFPVLIATYNRIYKKYQVTSKENGT